MFLVTNENMGLCLYISQGAAVREGEKESLVYCGSITADAPVHEAPQFESFYTVPKKLPSLQQIKYVEQVMITSSKKVIMPKI